MQHRRQQEYTVADSEDDPSPWLEASPEQQDTDTQSDLVPQGLQNNTAQLGVVDQAVDVPTASWQEAAPLLPVQARPLHAAVQQRHQPQPDQPTVCAPPYSDHGQPSEHAVDSMHEGCPVANHVGPARTQKHPAASAQQPAIAQHAGTRASAQHGGTSAPAQHGGNSASAQHEGDGAPAQHEGTSAPAQHEGTCTPAQHASGNQATPAEEVLVPHHASGRVSAWHASANSGPNEQQLAAAQAEMLEQVAVWLQRGGCVALCNRTEVPVKNGRGLQLMLAAADSPPQPDAVQDSAEAHAQTSQSMPVIVEAAEAMQVSESLPVKRKREAEVDLVSKRQRLCGRLRRSLRSISRMLIALWVFSKFHSSVLQRHD